MELSIAFVLAWGGAPDPSVGEDRIRRWVFEAKNGNTESACALYRTYVRRVYRGVRPLVSNEADAEDVTQEAFIRAFEALDRWEPRSDARFVSWLLMIALNVARKKLRTARRVKIVSPEDAIAARDTADAPVSARAGDPVLRDALLSALGEFAERDREIIVLRFGAELDATEIAELLGMTPANVRKVIERRRRELGQKLAAYDPSVSSEEPFHDLP